MNNTADPSELHALSAIYEAEGYIPPPDTRGNVFYKPYRPKLNPIQLECYDGIKTHLYNLLHGPRYSGKSWGGIHALVDHCRENFNARALMIILTRRQGEEGGVWHKFNTSVRQEWEQGGSAIFTDSTTNSSKDAYVWISNKYGGWSRVVMVSMPVEGFIQDRVKGTEWSFILVDEAQGLHSSAYFNFIVQQLGRDPNIPHQPVVYCANPAGPSHWLYDRFFIKPMESGVWNPDYFTKQVPMSDNLHNVPPNYIKNLIEATRGDDIEYRRMVLGEWIDVPEGDALFKQHFREELHMRGDAQGRGCPLPVPGLLVIEGWDLGPAHTSVHFMQFIPTVKKVVWLVFDEVNTVDKHLPYRKVVEKVLDRRKYWNERIGVPFQFVSISDESAFSQRRGNGSFDAKDIQDYSNGAIRLRPAPKGPGSVETRVRLTNEKLDDEELMISGICVKTKEMFLNLEEDPENRLKPKKKNRFLHPFDSLTYPWIHYNAGGRRILSPETGTVKPELYRIGG